MWEAARACRDQGDRVSCIRKILFPFSRGPTIVSRGFAIAKEVGP